MKSSAYYFHVKTKILADLQICISAPLMNLLFRTIPENICCFPKCLKSRLTNNFYLSKRLQDVFAKRIQEVLEGAKNVTLKI